MTRSATTKNACYFGAALVLGALGACGERASEGQGPCERLLVCCESLGAAMAQSCRDGYDRYHDADGADAQCQRAIDGFVQQNLCRATTGGPDAGAGVSDGGSATGDGASGGGDEERRFEGAENTDALCSDGKDNDGDGFVDCIDYSCSKNPALTVCEPKGAEDTDALCSDGKDNDGDGFVDCDDYSCSKNPALTVCEPKGAEDTDALCSDGKDNDGDGFVDCDDYSCSKSSTVIVCGGAPSCAKDLGSSSCATCTEDHCCAAATQCFFVNSACFSFSECFVTCNGGEAYCRSFCSGIYPGGEGDFVALRQCVQSHCASC